MEISFPKSLTVWLESLPTADRIRETMIATRNLKRIYAHYAK